MPTVSIIVPVYKSEKYLERCIRSILAQSFKDFELILVDDGSPDNCPEMCDEWAKKDARIRVVHQENKGASSARNRGISEAKGEYLMFCDSDDAVSDKWVERLISLADENTLPMGKYCDKTEDLGSPCELSVLSAEKVANAEYYRYNQSGIAGYLCNAIYCRDIVTENNITLRENAEKGDYNEDLIFALQYASKVENIVYTGYSDYLYDTRSDSMSHSFDKYYFAKYREKYNLWKSFLAENCYNADEQKSDLATKMLYHFLVSLQMEIDSGKNYGRFKEIVLCDEMQECVSVGDASKENPRIIKMVNNKQVFGLYVLYLLQNIKRRCKK